MKYRCKDCGKMFADMVQWCDNCCGNEFETLTEFTHSHDSNVYTDERIGNDG